MTAQSGKKLASIGIHAPPALCEAWCYAPVVARSDRPRASERELKNHLWF